MLLCMGLAVSSSDFYEWTDEEGITHFATSLDQVPQKYREQVKPPDARSRRAGAPPTDDEAPSGVPKAAAPAPSADSTLDRFEVPYKPFEGSARRVIIPVTINGTVTAPMALDTGSPGMVVSFELADRLGVFSRDKGTLVVEAAGIGGAVPAILTIIDSVSVGGARSSFVPTTVTFPISGAFQGLIGMDFLSDYTITIDPRKQVVLLSENPADPHARGGHGEDWWRNTFREFRGAHDQWREHARSTQGKLGTRAQAFVDFQVQESERLLRMLDVYASNHAVPRAWR